MSNDISSITIDVSQAVDSLESVTAAAEKACSAVERLHEAFSGLAEAMNTLNGSPHGGISFQMVGDVARADIKTACISDPPTIHAGSGFGQHEVYLDGVRVSHAIASDPEAGYVLVRPEPGEEFAPVAFNGNACKRLDGVVTFVMK